jgi:hypothetical protein
MKNQTLEQRAEKLIQDNFGNSLTPEEHPIAIEVVKEIFLSAEDLPFDKWQQQVSQFNQDLQTRLSQAETIPEQSALHFAILFSQYLASEQARNIFNNSQEELIYLEYGIKHAEFILEFKAKLCSPAVREQMLTLYVNAGVTQGAAPFNDAHKKLEYYQRGLKYAEDFLKQGETAAGVREQVLKLYNYAGITQGAAPFNNAHKQLEYYQRGLKYAEDFLKQGETAAKVREFVLRLYINAGVTQETAPFNDAHKQLEYYQHGLKHAEDFLKQGETATGVREYVLKLYDSYSSAYYNNKQIGQVIPILPMKGLWSWVALAQHEQRELIIHNWQNKLEISLAHSHFTTAFQNLLRTLVLEWHSPNLPHRHFGFMPTETLLAVSEGLYGLEQAMDNQKLQTVYDSLTHIAQSAFVQETQELQEKYHQAQQTLAALDEKPVWWHFLWRWWLNQKCDDSQARLQQLEISANNDNEWQSAVKKTEHALVEWLVVFIFRELASGDDVEQRGVSEVERRGASRKAFPTGGWERENHGLEDLPAIALGFLLIGDSLQTPPEQRVAEWLQSPPWKTVKKLKLAFSRTSWQKWVETPNNPLLSNWLIEIEHNDTVRRLKIVWAMENKAQPDLQAWLCTLLTDNHKPLQEKLEIAWESAQIASQRLARIFTALANANFQGDLLAKRDYTDVTYQQALATIILGDTETQITNAVRAWFEQQSPNKENHNHSEILNVFNSLKYRFTRATGLYHNRRSLELGNAVHEWAKVRLTEILQTEPPTQTDNAFQNAYYDFQPVEPQADWELQKNNVPKIPPNPPVTKGGDKLWELLERSRIGLTRLTLHLSDDWAETLGEQLWKDLDSSVRWLIEGYDPPTDKMWPPLATWLKTSKKWISKPPAFQTCQQRLNADEALVQPFFDPIQQRLRILWLDKDNLKLRDLPDECAKQHLWITESEGGLITTWIRGVEHLRKSGVRGVVSQSQDWQTVIASTPVTRLAKTLSEWASAQSLAQLTVIFPAPLGQLPWEALEPLENLLVREISIGHWLQTKSPKDGCD